ncbi:MAG TPA: ribose 5-phosphate isomerase B [Candidatus Dojkabacteria bacterium]
MDKQIFIGSDHAGFRLKEAIKKYLDEKNYKYEDLGTDSEESVDYPDYAKKVGEKVLGNPDSLGILMCGSGNGVCITANKIHGIRAAYGANEYLAEFARRHNNANVICLGGRVVGEEHAKSIIEAFLTSDFEGGRHEKRVNKMED